MRSRQRRSCVLRMFLLAIQIVTNIRASVHRRSGFADVIQFSVDLVSSIGDRLNFLRRRLQQDAVVFDNDAGYFPIVVR